MTKVLEPATEEVLAELPPAGVEETDAAVARAARAYPAWRAVEPADRGRLLLRVAELVEERLEDLARLEARNAGKPIADARGEMGMVAETFRYYAGAPERLLGDTIPVAGGVNMTFREPLGVVGLIVPWNFPLTIASWKMPTSRARPRRRHSRCSATQARTAARARASSSSARHSTASWRRSRTPWRPCAWATRSTRTRRWAR